MQQQQQQEQQFPPLDYSLRPKQGPGFGFPKALRKLFREPGPARTTDLRNRNVSFDISSPNLSSSIHPIQQFQANFSPAYSQNQLQFPLYGSAINLAEFPSSSETFDVPLPNQAPFQDAFPARVSFDQRQLIPPVDEEHSPGWAKRVLQLFSRVRKLKESISTPKEDKGQNYPIFTHRDLEKNNIPQVNVTKKPSLKKRKPVPPISETSLDSQLFPTIGKKRDQPDFEMASRDPFVRYSVGEVVQTSRPEAFFMNQHTSSGYQHGPSAMPHQSALGLDLGDYNLMNAASFSSPRFANGKYMYKEEEQNLNQNKDTAQNDEGEEEVSVADSAPTGEKIKMAKEYADRKFNEWISRTSNVSAFPALHSSWNSNKVENQIQHDLTSSIEPLNSVKQTNLQIEHGKGTEMEKDQNESDSPKTSIKAPVDPFELDVRLSDLISHSRKDSALRRTSHHKRTPDKRSNPNNSRNLAAKMMSKTPDTAGIRYSGTMLEEDQPTVDQGETKSGEVTPKKNPLKKEKEKATSPSDPEIPTKRKAVVEQTHSAHEKLQPRHWRSTEVLYQDTCVGNDPVKAPTLHEREKEEMDSAIGVVEPVTISSEDLELLGRVQTWRSCVSITPAKKLYAPSASATEPSTMSGINQVHTGADERASEWTSISRRVEKGIGNDSVPMQRTIHYDFPRQKFEEFNDHRASKSYQLAETRTSMRYAPAPFKPAPQESGDGQGHISFQGPPSELIKFLQYSFDLSLTKKDQETRKSTPSKKDEELLIDLSSPEVEKQSQNLQFGTQHIRLMTEADSKRLFDLVGDRLSDNSHLGEHVKSEGKQGKKAEVKASKHQIKASEKKNHSKSKTKEDEAKVWELLHKTDKDGLTAMERLLNAYAEELGTFSHGNTHKTQLPYTRTKQDLSNTHEKHYSSSTKKKSKEMSKPSTYNTSKTKVDDEKVENVLQSIFEYVQGAGDVSQIHSTLISMHKDLLDRTKDPAQRKSIDERLMKLEQAVFAKRNNE